MCAGVQVTEAGGFRSLELPLQAGATCLTWVLGTELLSLGKVIVLNC